MGTLQRRPMDLPIPVGMDLGRRCAVGICSLPLWPLGLVWRLLGLGSRTLLGAALVRPGDGGLVWRPALWHRFRLWFRRRIRLVPARLGRAILSVVWRGQGVFPERQHQQYAHYQHQQRYQQLLQQPERREFLWQERRWDASLRYQRRPDRSLAQYSRKRALGSGERGQGFSRRAAKLVEREYQQAECFSDACQ